MYKVSSPALVSAACRCGIIAGLPRHNAASSQEFESWLQLIALSREKSRDAGQCAGILAVNLNSSSATDALTKDIILCKKYGVDIIVNATGDPTDLTKQVQDNGLLMFADVINMCFAEKAIAAGVDGIIAIGTGGGGHSGTLSPFVLVPRIREIFCGVIVMAGCIGNGASIRAAEILGADLAYLGTRFIASAESAASDEYKACLLSATSKDLIYTRNISGIPANWLTASLRAANLDPDRLPEPTAASGHGHSHLPDSARPWTNLWSAGQGVDLISDIPSVEQLVNRLKLEYRNAVDAKPFSGFAV